MTKTAIKDYSASGLTLQQAMVDHMKRYPDKSRRPDHIFWQGKPVKTTDAFETPRSGRIAAEVLSGPTSVQQGFDLKINGFFELADGAHVGVLRTWNLPEYEPSVEYRYESIDGVVRVWNVYKVDRGGEVVEKWTGNAGFWVEVISPASRIYHCSPGTVESPDFESLIFKVSIIDTIH